MKEIPEGVEYHLRQGDEQDFAFFMNYNQEAVELQVPEGTDLLTGEAVTGTVVLDGLESMIVATKK